MAVSLAVYPEKFDLGGFPAWLRNFECCADANRWSDADKRQLFCSLVAREQHFTDFEQRTLRPNEDPLFFCGNFTRFWTKPTPI